MSDAQHPESDQSPLFAAERVKAFIDAVVAIALTLLILPLMESVTEVARRDETASVFFAEHWPQVFSFVLSFVLISMFWLSHHRLFARVERVSTPLLWLTMLWLLTIVWLPVATAMSGQMDPSDPVVKIVYIGSLIATCAASVFIRIFLLRHPELHEIGDSHLRGGMAADLAMAVLFSVALTLTLLIPDLSYFPMFILLFVGPLQALIARMLGAPNPKKVSGKAAR